MSEPERDEFNSHGIKAVRNQLNPDVDSVVDMNDRVRNTTECNQSHLDSDGDPVSLSSVSEIHNKILEREIPTNSTNTQVQQDADKRATSSRPSVPTFLLRSGNIIDTKNTMGSDSVLRASNNSNSDGPGAHATSSSPSFTPSQLPVTISGRPAVVNASNYNSLRTNTRLCAMTSSNKETTASERHHPFDEEEDVNVTHSNTDYTTIAADMLPVAFEAHVVGDTCIATALPLEPQQPQQRKWRFVCLSLVLIVVVGAAVGVGCASGRCGATAPVTSSSYSGSTAARASAVGSEINNITLANRTIAYPIGLNAQPEELALQWLIDSDPLKLSAANATDKFRLRQRYALLTLWFQSPLNAWTHGWLVFAEECQWYGVYCNQTDLGTDIGVQNAVTEIQLSNNNLHGKIPPDLGLLTAVKDVSLCCQSLSGSLPSSIGLWTDLVSFNVSDNSLSGTIPTSIGNWIGIETVDFEHNNFAGSVLPSSLCAVNSTVVKSDCASKVACDCCLCN